MSRLRQRPTAAAPAYLALSCIGLIASPALAQDDGTSGAKPARLGGVTVTDTAIDEQGYKVDEAASPKYTAPLLDTPKTVIVLPAQVIQESGSTTFVEALRRVPGITFGAGEGGNPEGDRPFIRGFDAQGSTYLDGLRSVGAQSREIFAIEQIEVVKGGDSTMGGRGGAGGSLNLVSKMPHLGTDARADLSYGTDDYKRATLDTNYQIGETAAIRLNAMWHDADVAKRDVVTYNRWGISPSIALGLGTATRAYLNYYHMQSDDIPDPGIPFERSNAQAGTTGLLTVGPAEVVNGRAVDRSTFYGLANRDFRTTNTDELLFRFEHDLSDTIRVRNTAKYANVKQAYIIGQPDDSQGNVANGKLWRRVNTRYTSIDALADQLDLSGTFETGSIRHSFSIGGEAGWEQSKRGSYNVNTGSTTLPGSGTPGTSLANGSNPGFTSRRCNNSGAAASLLTEVGAGSNYNCTDLFNPDPYDPWVNYAADGVTPLAIARNPISGITEATTYALYAADTITITDALLLNLGVRYDWYNTTSKTVSTTAPTTEVSLKDSFLNYQAGLVFKPVPNGSLYISHAKSTTPPGSMIGEGSEGNAITAATLNDLKAEETKSYEIGAKWEFFDAALGLNFALFRTETKNARATGATGLLEYIGERRIDGFEVAFNGKPLPFWSIFGGYTYTDSEVRNGGFDAQRRVSPTEGRPFPNTPKHSFTAWTTFDIADRFQIGGGAIYSSRQYGGFAYVSATDSRVIERSVPGYWRFDATAGVDITDNVALRVNVQNLTNKRYYDRVYTTHYAAIAPGRSAFATLSLKY